ncbi:hypothetical protein [Xanthomonas phage BUDD]|nr:hypothetical protein [Xanthomonas phage BUDD]
MILAFFLTWTVLSLFWFYGTLGEKHRKISRLQNVCEHIFGLPILAVALVVGLILKLRK